jgi:hypothetical protein
MQTRNIYNIRYLPVSDINFPDHPEIFSFLKEKSQQYGRFIIDQDSLYEFLIQPAFSETMTGSYNTHRITDWDMLQKYMKSYLLRQIPSTPFYAIPYARETTYILPELLSIIDTGVITLDSEPGFFIQGSNPYLQLPYVKLLASVTQLEKIINVFKSFQSKYIALACCDTRYIEPYDEFIREHFPKYEFLDSSIGAITFGVSNVASYEDLEEYLEYILTNSFFVDIWTIIQQSK